MVSCELKIASRHSIIKKKKKERNTLLNSPGRGDPWHCFQSDSHLAVTRRSTGHDSVPVANIGFSAAVTKRRGGGKCKDNSFIFQLF